MVLLRDTYGNNLTVSVDYFVDSGKRNVVAVRIAPRPLTGRLGRSGDVRR